MCLPLEDYAGDEERYILSDTTNRDAKKAEYLKLIDKVLEEIDAMILAGKVKDKAMYKKLLEEIEIEGPVQ